MKNILFVTLVLLLLHGKGSELPGPNVEGPNGKEPIHQVCERECP